MAIDFKAKIEAMKASKLAATNAATATTLDDAGFTFIDPNAKPNYRLFVVSRAKEKHGKTHFSMTAPGDVAYISYDKGDEGVLDKFAKAGKRIFKCDLPKPVFRKAGTKNVFNKDALAKAKADEKREMEERISRIEQYEAYWLKGRDAYEAAIETPKIRTVVIDTCTEYYESLRLARFGRLTEIKPQHYGPVKQEFRDVMRLGLDRPDINIIAIHKLKKEYKQNSKDESSWTGKWEMQGFDDMPYIGQVVITHMREALPGGGVKFGIHIDDCRQNPDIIGQELWSDDGMCDFANLGMLVFPESQPEDWE